MNRKVRQYNTDKKISSKPSKDINEGEKSFTQPFYDNQPIKHFSQNQEQLSHWLSNPHPDYNMASWCFYGNIETASGETVALSTIVQQQLDLSAKSTPFLAEFSYCDNATNGYTLAPFLIYPFDVQFKDPFFIKVAFNPIPKINLELALVSGKMGDIGAQYRLSGLVVDTKLTEWEYDVKLTDTLGTIQVGYGPQSFLPQWITPQQRQSITNDYNSNVDAYLKATGDTMMGQGSYYYSFPLLKVNSFSLKKDNTPYASATKGNLWVDYVVQSFNAQTLPIAGSASWQFFAIQFPQASQVDNFNAALMVSIVKTDLGTLQMARFYDKDAASATTPNGALKPYFEWNMNEISFKVNKEWPDAKGKKYPVAFTIELISPQGAIHLKATAVRDNQVVEEVQKYEGVFNVTASIKLGAIDKPVVNGYAWAEVH